MASSLNKVTLIGNLGKDPEVRALPSGAKVSSFTIATTESRLNKTTGEREDHPEWHKIVVFNERLVELIEKYVRKGTKLYIEGQLQTRSWTDKNTGNERYVTEVVLSKFRGEMIILESKRDILPLGAASSSAASEAEAASVPDYPNSDDEDELPF